MPTDVFFRVDASRAIGGGHLSRCLTLAARLGERGADMHFVCKALHRPYKEQIEAFDCKLTILPGDIAATGERRTGWMASDGDACAAVITATPRAHRILIVDHYSIDLRWEQVLRPCVDRIVVIDDLANRPHDCDVLVDQAHGQDASRYGGLIPDGCKGLFGSRYALLRPEFVQWRGKRTQTARPLKGRLIVHVFFGSEDVRGNTLRFAVLLLGLQSVQEVRVAVSASFADTAALEKLRRGSDGRLSWKMVGATMAEHMAGCDVALGAPGQATWERACLGLPALYIAVSDNQVPILERLDREGFCVFLGADRALPDGAFRAGCERFLSSEEALHEMKAKGMSAVDGLGSSRVADAAMSAISS